MPLPVTHPTSCAFGGAALDELYVTSARVALTAEERARQPQAGGVFRLRPGVVGRPRQRLRTRGVSGLEFHDDPQVVPRRAGAARGELHGGLRRGARDRGRKRRRQVDAPPHPGRQHRARPGRAAPRRRAAPAPRPPRCAQPRDRRRPPGDAGVPQPERERQRVRRARADGPRRPPAARAPCASARASCWRACTWTCRPTPAMDTLPAAQRQLVQVARALDLRVPHPGPGRAHDVADRRRDRSPVRDPRGPAPPRPHPPLRVPSPAGGLPPVRPDHGAARRRGYVGTFRREEVSDGGRGARDGGA